MPAVSIPTAVRRFLAQPNIAVVASVMPSGMPHTAATWYDYEDGRILLNMDESRRRLEYMRLDLIDEWHLGLHPYVADEGTLLFDDVPKSYRLDLISSAPFGSTGILELQYRRHR